MQSDADRAKGIFLGATAYGDRAERDAYVARACDGNRELKGWVDGLLAAFDRAALFNAAPPGPTGDFTPLIGAPGIPRADGAGTDVESGLRNVTADLPPTHPDPAATSAYDSNPAGATPLGSGDFNATTDLPSEIPDPSVTSEYDSNAAKGDRAFKSGKTVRGDSRTVGSRPDGSPPESDTSPAVAGYLDVGPGTVIDGRYILVGLIGEGGMGSVYLAEQSEPVRREVAIKLIKAGFDSRSVLARFSAERQALALMEHPNIARVYDGGTTAAGTPYFAMELVRGIPITNYCDEKRLPPSERLDLFVKVCRAVQHAHQKGIIHRDLKPGNILVTEVDGKPTPKVIDFGVAKATEQPLTDQSFSDFGAIVGTPVYMSPEQADPSSMDVDTRTDVYALGVVLYELLTGTPPIRAKDFKRGALLEMLRMVREVEPPRPSTRASSDDALPSIAANRALEPGQLLSLLRGDIDWIVMKALEKNREQRYESANGLASDIQRYLASETVSARPPTRVYRLRKFVRRNRAAVTAGAAFAALFLAGVAGVVVQWREAVYQRAQAVAATAEAEKNFGVALEQRMVALKALGQVLDISRRDLPKIPGMQEIQKKFLDISKASLGNIAENPLVRISLKDSTLAAAHASTARLLLTTNDAKGADGEFDRAEDIFERIVRSAPEDPQIETAKQDLAVIKMAHSQVKKVLGQAAESRRKLDEALELIGATPPEAPDDFRRNLANLYQLIGAAESVVEPRRALEWYDRKFAVIEGIAAVHPSRAISLELCESYIALGRAQFRLRGATDAEKYYRLARKIAEGEAEKSDEALWKNRLATTRELLGDLRLRTGKPEEARREYLAATEIFRKIAEADPKNIQAVADLSRILYSLALAEERSAAKAEAPLHWQESLRIRKARADQNGDAVSLRELMVALARNLKTKEASALAETIASKFGTDPHCLIEVANCYAICAGVEPPGGNAENFALKSLETLRQLIKLGYKDVVNLETEPDLDALRARDDFKALLADLGNRIR